jgi:hypothetical protein
VLRYQHEIGLRAALVAGILSLIVAQPEVGRVMKLQEMLLRALTGKARHSST